MKLVFFNRDFEIDLGMFTNKTKAETFVDNNRVHYYVFPQFYNVQTILGL